MSTFESVLREVDDLTQKLSKVKQGQECIEVLIPVLTSVLNGEIDKTRIVCHSRTFEQLQHNAGDFLQHVLHLSQLHFFKASDSSPHVPKGFYAHRRQLTDQRRLREVRWIFDVCLGTKPATKVSFTAAVAGENNKALDSSTACVAEASDSELPRCSSTPSESPKTKRPVPTPVVATPIPKKVAHGSIEKTAASDSAKVVQGHRSIRPLSARQAVATKPARAIPFAQVSNLDDSADTDDEPTLDADATDTNPVSPQVCDLSGLDGLDADNLGDDSLWAQSTTTNPLQLAPKPQPPAAPAEAWVAKLASGDLVDVFFQGQWCEGRVHSVKIFRIDTDVDATSSSGQAVKHPPRTIQIHVRCFGSRVYAHFKSESGDDKSVVCPGATITNHHTRWFADGTLAPPYSHVFNWRKNLRVGQALEFVTKRSRVYVNHSGESILHYHQPSKQWWVSMLGPIASLRALGYFYTSKGTPDRPPASTPSSTPWLLLIGKDWHEDHREFQVTLEEVDGEVEAVSIRIVDRQVLDDCLVARKLGDLDTQCFVARIVGRFVLTESNSYAQACVVKKNEKDNRVTFARPSRTDYIEGIGDVQVNPTPIEKNLDSDDIRELSLISGMRLARCLSDKAHAPYIFPATAGIGNMGNTCYMNAVFQCLFALEPLLRYFFHRAPATTHNKNSAGGDLASAFSDLVRKYVRASVEATRSTLSAVASPATGLSAATPDSSGGLKHRSEAAEPESVIDMITPSESAQKSGAVVPAFGFEAEALLRFAVVFRQFKPQFTRGQQHCAAEFLSELLDLLHEDLRSASNSTSSSSCNNSSTVQASGTRLNDGDAAAAPGGGDDGDDGDDDIINRLFNHSTQSQLRCPKCDASSYIPSDMKVVLCELPHPPFNVVVYKKEATTLGRNGNVRAPALESKTTPTLQKPRIVAFGAEGTNIDGSVTGRAKQIWYKADMRGAKQLDGDSSRSSEASQRTPSIASVSFETTAYPGSNHSQNGKGPAAPSTLCMWALRSALRNPPPLSKYEDRRRVQAPRVTLEDCLRRSTLPEEVDALCSSCCPPQKLQKQDTLSSLAPIMCFHLKRSGRSQKSLVDVDFPFELDLSVHVSCMPSDNPESHADGDSGTLPPKRSMLYELVGVIHHIGNSLSAGHYVAHSRRGDKWIRFNDDVVTCVARDEVRSTYVDEIYGTATPYLLFYQRCENINERQATGPPQSGRGPLKTHPCDATSIESSSVAVAVASGSSSTATEAPEHSIKSQQTPPAPPVCKHESARQEHQTVASLGGGGARVFPDVFSVTLFDCEDKGSAIAHQVAAQASIDLHRLVIARVSRTGHVAQLVFFAPSALDEEFHLGQGDRIAAFEVPESFDPAQHFLLEVHLAFSILPQNGARSVGGPDLHDKPGTLSSSVNVAASEASSGASILVPMDRKADDPQLAERARDLFDRFMGVETVPVPMKVESTPANSPTLSDSQTHIKRRTPLSDASKAGNTSSSTAAAAAPTAKRAKKSQIDSLVDNDAENQASTPTNDSFSQSIAEIAAVIEGDTEGCSGTEAMLEEASRTGADGIDSDDDVPPINCFDDDDSGVLVVDIVPKQPVHTALAPHAPLQCIITSPFKVPTTSVYFFRVRAPPGHKKSCRLRARIPIPPKWIASMKESVLAVGDESFGFIDAFIISALASFDPVLRQRPWSSVKPDGGAWKRDGTPQAQVTPLHWCRFIPKFEISAKQTVIIPDFFGMDGDLTFAKAPADYSPGNHVVGHFQEPVEQLKQLREMGFHDKDKCFQCLVEGGGDVSLAAALLLPN